MKYNLVASACQTLAQIMEPVIKEQAPCSNYALGVAASKIWGNTQSQTCSQAYLNAQCSFSLNVKQVERVEKASKRIKRKTTHF